MPSRSRACRAMAAHTRQAGSYDIRGRVDGAVCGFASGGGILWSELSTGSEVSALYLLDIAKRRGVGRALFQAELTALAGRGFTSTGLWVLTGNAPARRFYEAMGG